MELNSKTIKSLENLVEYSTDFRFRRRASFRQLHIALIKHFFNATTVVLDVLNNQVYLGIDVIEKGTEVCIRFTNYDQFIKSCIRDTSDNHEFYSNILHYYNRTEQVA